MLRSSLTDLLLGPMKNFRRKTTWLHLSILLVLVGAAVQGLTWAGWLERPENIYRDLWHQLAGRRYAPAARRHRYPG